MSFLCLLMFLAGAGTAAWAEDQKIKWLTHVGMAVGGSALGIALVMAGRAVLFGGLRRAMFRLPPSQGRHRRPDQSQGGTAPTSCGLLASVCPSTGASRSPASPQTVTELTQNDHEHRCCRALHEI